MINAPPDCHRHDLNGLGMPLEMNAPDCHQHDLKDVSLINAPPDLHQHVQDDLGRASGTDARQTFISTFRMVWGVPLEPMPAMNTIRKYVFNSI